MMTEAEMALKAVELDLRLKELEIENKEYEKAHRPGVLKLALTNPVVMAAIIAGLASRLLKKSVASAGAA